ncbi:MAG: hypothetical protein AB7O98_02300 [Hyphomonadaceae bacterium]
MALNALLDADTETFETGPYNRAVRVRKWVYLFVGATVVVANGWFANSDLLKWLGVSAVPATVIWQAATLGLLYFLFQYTLVGVQVMALYPSTLSKRFGEKTRAELRRVDLALQKLRDETKDDEQRHRVEVVQIQERIKRAANNGDGNERKIQEAALEGASQSFEAVQRARREQYEELSRELDMVSHTDHSQNPIVRSSEMALDAWRLGPPFAVGVFVLFRYGHVGA